MQWDVILPAPALHVVHPTQCRGGQYHILPGAIVDGVGGEAEVAHGGVVAYESHLPVVPGGAEVNVANVQAEVVATADDARRGLVQGAHGGVHLKPVVGGHLVFL